MNKGFTLPIVLILMSVAWYWCLTTQQCADQLLLLLRTEEQHTTELYCATSLGTVLEQTAHTQRKELMQILSKGPIEGTTNIKTSNTNIPCACKLERHEEDILITVTTPRAAWSSSVSFVAH
jgi:hypothetical protein